ncbi:MAG: hypothetical protein AAGI54_06340 [Planctomycetota bacterium]
MLNRWRDWLGWGEEGEGEAIVQPIGVAATARVLIGLTVVAGLAGGLWWAERELASYHAARAFAADEAAVVELADRPAWMSTAVERRVTGVAAEWAEASWTRGRGLRLAAMALAEEPWVASVREVSRASDGRVVIEATYRRPVALVRGADAYRLVDAAGVRLPGLYAAQQAERVGLPIVVGCVERSPAPGQAWRSEALRGGLSLIAWVSGEVYADQIAAFDIGGRDARGRVRLVIQTVSGGRVTWGLPPGSEMAVEPIAARKLEAVRHVHEELGSIDAGGQTVDVTGAQIAVTRQPTL